MASDVRDEVDPYAAGPFVGEVAEETEGPEVSFEFFAEEGRGLTAASVTGFLGAEEDEGGVRTWAGC